MHYVYLLFSLKDKGFYIGRSTDLKRRITEHTRGEVASTKNRLPLKLVHHEAFLMREDAAAREVYLKSGYGRQQLKSSLKRLLNRLESSP